MEHFLIPVVIIVATVVVALSIGVLLSLRKSDMKPANSNFKGTDLGNELSSGLRGSLSRLPISTKNLDTVSQAVGKEFAKQTEKVREEIQTEYRDKIRSKDEVIKAAEKKIINMTQDYLKLGRERKSTETVVRSIAEGRVVVNDKGIAVQVNEAGEKILGKKKEEILGRPVADLKGKKQVVSYVQAMAHAEEEVISQYTEDAHSQKLIRSSSAIIESESGQTRGMIASLPTEIQSQEIENSKTEFIASVTHELRTPLVCIQKSLAALKEETGAGTSEQKAYLDIAERNSQKLTHFVNQILDFSHLESGRVQLHYDLVNVSDLVHEVVSDLKTWSAEKKIKITVSVADPALSLEADRIRLGQVLTNLISNALKFTKTGGQIRVAASMAVASEDFIPDGDFQYMQFEVEDTGVGIPEAEVVRVFEKFTQASNYATEDEQGSGLGLSIVKEIVAKHQGKVWVKSEEGKGSRFYFVLPQYSQIQTASL